MLSEGRAVEGEVGVQDRQLIILLAVLVEQELREEGEVLRVPGVPRVARAEREAGSQSIQEGTERQTADSHARDDTSVQGQLRCEGSEQGTDGASTGTDVVPIERQREETETLVSGGTAEDAGDPGALAVREADDRDTRERPASGAVSEGREGTDARATYGAMYSGNHSHTKMPTRTAQKKMRRFRWVKTPPPRCMASKSCTWGMRKG